MEKELEVSLFDRLGGLDALNAVVELFYSKVLADDSISHFFTDTDMDAQSGKMKAFLGYVCGAKGPLAVYNGKRMKEAHAHLKIQEAHFNAVASHLVATLKELNVPQNLIDEVVAIALSVKNEVLGI